MILNNKKNKFFALALFMFCFSLVFVFGIRNNLKNNNKELYKTIKSIEKEKDLIKILRADHTNLSKSSHIYKLIKGKLNLQDTKSFQIKKLSDFEFIEDG